MITRSAEEAVLEAIFRHPTKGLSFREIERGTGISIATVSKYAYMLEEKELVIIEERPNANYVRANTGSKLFRQLKQTNNLRLLYETGIVAELERKYRPDAIILFGSYSQGEDFEDSDIDIAIVNGRDSEWDRKAFEKTLGREISVHSITLERAEPEFLGSLANGIVLAGYFSYGLPNLRKNRKGKKEAAGPAHGRRTPQKRGRGMGRPERF